MSNRRFQCQVCNHVHDEAGGERWEDLPDDWVCPDCGASKADFAQVQCELS